MKLKKLIFSVLTIELIIILNSTEVYALLPRVIYNPINVVISRIMNIY